jgi:hypothetical protein
MWLEAASSAGSAAREGSNMDLTARILSILALVVSLSALLWQFVSWRLSGPRVRADSLSGIALGQPDHPEVLVLIVNSRGRLPITVQQWGFVIKGTLQAPTGWTSGPELPHRMEPDSEARWMLDYREARQWLRQNYPSQRRYRDLVPFVRRGGGKWVYGGKVVRIWEEGSPLGPDPRISGWWRRFLPGYQPIQTRHGTGWDRLPRQPEL